MQLVVGSQSGHLTYRKSKSFNRKGTPVSRRKSIETIESEIKRVAIYVRYSNLGGRNKDSLTTMDTQESECRGHCNAKKWEVVKVLADPGRSAFKKAPRPEYDEALRMIQTGQIDAIVVWKVDRFTRNVYQFNKDWHEIQSAGGHFVSVVDQFDTSHPMGRLMLQLIVGFAEMESEMKSQRAIPMHAALKEQGKVGPGPRPYGYQRTDSKTNNGKGAILTQIPKEAKLLQTAAAWVLGGGSLSGFIHHHQPDSSQANKKMTYHGLRSALINPTTAGLRSWDGSPDGYSKGNWTPILDRETWDRVVALITDPERRVHSTPTSKQHLLSGLMTCPKCDKNVTARGWVSNVTKQKTKRYACPICYRSIDMAAADPIAMEMLFDAVPQSKWEAWQTSGRGWDIELVKAIENRMMMVDRRYSEGKLSDERWMALTADLENQLSACQENEALDLPTIPNLRAGWDGLTLCDKQKVFRQAFEKIHILPMAGSSRNDIRTRLELIER